MIKCDTLKKHLVNVMHVVLNDSNDYSDIVNLSVY